MSVKWHTSPVSMTEMGIYLDWTKNLQGTSYNLPFLYRLPEGTDLDRLSRALERTLRAHPALISRFRTEADGSVSRMIPEAKDYPISIYRETGEPELHTLVKPFTDPEGELYRLHILQGAEHAYLFVDFHHIIYDGSSNPVFLRELNRAYAGEKLEGEGTTATDFARQEREARGTDAFKQAAQWFEALLTDAEIISAPIHDHEHGEPRNAYLEWSLDVKGGQVSQKVKRLGIKTSTFFTGAYGYLLSRFAGNREALYASVHSGRTPEIMGSIGMFANDIVHIHHNLFNTLHALNTAALRKKVSQAFRNVT